jgi:adenylate kinase family enzyme
VSLRICVAGKISSGKSTLSKAISSNIGFPIISFGGILRDYSESNGLPTARKDLQRLGQEIIDQFGFEGFVRWMINHSTISWDDSLIIDGLRHKDLWEYPADVSTDSLGIL